MLRYQILLKTHLDVVLWKITLKDLNASVLLAWFFDGKCDTFLSLPETVRLSQTGFHLSLAGIEVPISIRKRPDENLVKKHPKY